MARRIAVSFENEVIRIVYASLRRGNLIIKKTLVLRDEEFDDFLKKEKARHFTIVCDFKTFYQDVILLPPVKEKYFRNIIEAEIRKKSPELRDFSFFYEILGERMHEGRKVMETFVFAVNSYDLSKVINRFDRHGKTISCLYNSAFVLSRIVQLLEGIEEDHVLCIAETEMGKTLFLVKNGKIHFIRTAQSMESGIHDFDVQNINMTINYCRQTLKLSTSRIVFIGSACHDYHATMDLLAPSISWDCSEIFIDKDVLTTCIVKPVNVKADGETLTKFIIPISAILPVKVPGYGNLLPQGYRSLRRQKTILAYYAAFFLLLSIIGLGYIKMKYSEIAVIKKKIDSLRSEIRGMESIRIGYENKKKEFDKIASLISFVNTMNSSPDIQKALVALSSIKELHGKDINIGFVDINPEGNMVRIKLKGSVSAANFTAMQQAYQNLIKAIKKTEGIEIVSDKIDIKDKGFYIELRYQGGKEAD